MKIKHRIEVAGVPGSGGVTVGDLAGIVDAAPADAEVVAIMGERGSQRDPEPFLKALAVTWETET